MQRGRAGATAGTTIAIAIALGSCIGEPGYVCSDDAQCLQRAEGRCEADAWCSYPDDACPSGRRYGPHAPSGIADACVDEAGGTTTAGTGDDGPPAPENLCGNGTIDGDEVCDDGNRMSDDGCPAHCAAPGDVLWTARWDGPDHDDDRGFALALHEPSGTFYVAGISIQPNVGEEILVQRWRILDGEVLWTRTVGGAADADDKGEQVAVDAAGDVIVAGRIVETAGDADVWLRKYTPDGDETWTTTYDAGGLDDSAQGVTITSTGEIVAVGWVTIDRGGGAVDEDVWIGRYDGDGSPIGDPILRGRPAAGDHAIDTAAIGGGNVLVTGRLTNDAGAFDVWTARYDAAGTVVWEDLATRDPVGNEARGVGLGVGPAEVCAVGGVLSNDIWIQLYDAAGVPGVNLVANEGDRHDEAADVAFLPDGRFIAVGFVNFGTVGFATGDFWIRMYAPDGTPQWTDIVDGASEEIDKALAVEVTSDETAIVVGYETVPGQSRDVWARRYAL